MDCIIKIIKGPEVGQQFHCTGTEAVIGRSPRSQVRLQSPSASYEHAVITRNGDDYFIENLSAGGTFVNEERIAGKVRLRTRDQLRFGADTLARVEAVPTGGRAGSSRRLLVVSVFALLAVVITLALANPFSTPAPKTDLHAAYAKLEPWTQEEVAAHQLPAETLPLMREAWRLEMSGDKAGSTKLWRRLNVLLAAEEPTVGFQSAADKDPLALAKAASNDPRYAHPNDDDMGAALVQFVSRMARR